MVKYETCFGLTVSNVQVWNDAIFLHHFLVSMISCPYPPPGPQDSSTMPSLAGNQIRRPRMHAELTRNRTKDQWSEGKGLNH